MSTTKPETKPFSGSMAAARILLRYLAIHGDTSAADAIRLGKLDINVSDKTNGTTYARQAGFIKPSDGSGLLRLTSLGLRAAKHDHVFLENWTTSSYRKSIEEKKSVSTPASASIREPSPKTGPAQNGWHDPAARAVELLRIAGETAGGENGFKFLRLALQVNDLLKP
jgi:hypothetical protein